MTFGYTHLLRPEFDEEQHYDESDVMRVRRTSFVSLLIVKKYYRISVKVVTPCSWQPFLSFCCWKIMLQLIYQPNRSVYSE